MQIEERKLGIIWRKIMKEAEKDKMSLDRYDCGADRVITSILGQ